VNLIEGVVLLGLAGFDRDDDFDLHGPVIDDVGIVLQQGLKLGVVRFGGHLPQQPNQPLDSPHYLCRHRPQIGIRPHLASIVLEENANCCDMMRCE